MPILPKRSSAPIHIGKASSCAALLAGSVMILGLVGDASAAPRERVKPALAAKPEIVPEGPLTLVVSIRDQRLTVFSGADQVARVPVSTGTRGHETPTGIFSVIQKERMHYSNLYNSAPMPFMQRLTWSGIALHAGYLPGYPASHGCVRMPHEFARRLFSMTRMGARVIVTQSDAAPVALSHPGLMALAAASPAPPELQHAEDRAPQMAPPMHLGAALPPDGAASSSETSPPLNSAGNSLLRKAEQSLAERTLAVEAGRVAKSGAAARLENAQLLLREAREASQVGRSELNKARARLRSLESELDSLLQGRAPLASRTSRGDEIPLAEDGTTIDPRVQMLSNQIEAARTEVNDKDETLHEISEEMAPVERARAEASLAYEDATFRLKLAEEDLKEARRDLAKRQLPVSLFVSRKNGRLYVRQGFEPLFETQVSIDDPDLPVGTHVYSAIGKDAGGQIRWTAVTVPVASAAPLGRASASDSRRPGLPKRAGSVTAPTTPALGVTAVAALDRLKLPTDVIGQLADLVKPGSSLIISDQPLSQETGKATDLIVLTR